MNGEDGRRREMEGFSLNDFAMTGLVLRDDLVLHCGGTLPTSVLGVLQFRAP